MGKPSPKPNQSFRPQCDERTILFSYPSIYSLKSLQNLFSKAPTLKKEMLQDPQQSWIKARNNLEQKLKDLIESSMETTVKEVLKLQKGSKNILAI